MDENSLQELKARLKERIYGLKDDGNYSDKDGNRLGLKPIGRPEVIVTPIRPIIQNGKYLVFLKEYRVMMTDNEIESVFQISGDVKLNDWSDVHAHVVAAQYGPSAANAYLLGGREFVVQADSAFYAVQYFKIIDREISKTVQVFAKTILPEPGHTTVTDQNMILG